MSGKYSKKTKNAKSTGMSAQRKNLIIAVAVVSLLLIAAVAVLLGGRQGDAEESVPSGNTTIATGGFVADSTTDPIDESTDPSQDPSQDSTSGTDNTDPSDVTDATEDTTAENQETQPQRQFLFDLGSDVTVDRYINYTGAFTEDWSFEVVTDVLAIQVTNSGDKCIQLMNIVLSDGENQAEFSLSTLLPGQTVVVMERNRMRYSQMPEFTQCSAENVAFFSEMPDMCSDLVEIQCLNGVLNVTNISGQDIDSDIVIYYKNYVGGVYYGGVTYRLTISGGLKAGEIRQGSAEQFNPDNTVIVFVTCG